MAKEERVEEKAEKKQLGKKVAGQQRVGALRDLGAWSRKELRMAEGPAGLRDWRVSWRPFGAVVEEPHSGCLGWNLPAF